MTQEEIYSSYGVAAAILPPSGICYLASVLENEGHVVQIIEGIAEKTTPEQLKEKVVEFDPQIIGITALTVAYKRAIETVKIIKEVNRDAVILFGGPHVSSIPIKTFEETKIFDVGVVGEGELTIIELVKHLKNNKFKNYKKGLEKIKGIVFNDDEGKVIMTPRRELIQDLDVLPSPARHLLPDITMYNTLLAGGQKPNIASLVPSRGCPYQCIYCDQNVFGHKWRVFSAEYLIKEIEDLVKNYGVRTVQIQDDLFTLNRDRVETFCRLLKEKNIKINWNLSSRVNLIDDKLAKLMKEAGCDIVYFGIESGNQDVLNKIKKGITLEEAKEGVSIAKKAGLQPHGSFILGLPFDTKDTIEETINFAKSLDLDVVSFHLATPFPNTELEQIAPDYGTVYSIDWSQYRSHPDEVTFTPKGMTKEYLLKKQREAYRRFYFRPKIILNKLKSINSFEALSGHVKAALTLFKF